MPRIADTLTRPGSDWRFDCASLGDSAIQESTGRIGLPLPPALVDLYRACNGGEGSLPFQPWTFVLWGIDEVADLRAHEHSRRYYTDLVFFGGDGGGDYFALNAAGQIILIDPIAGEESTRIVAESFDAFVQHVGTQPLGGVPQTGEA
jgi:hypothetical protein